MRMVDIIQKKRDGNELSTEEIQFFIKSYTDGEIPDYQASALAMAVYFRGMTDREMADLTLSMAKSGDTVDLSPIKGVKVDKHSTGGVGDKTSLVLAPMVASCGIPVAKMSGRGLGHTGGTIDKLESVPGFHVELDREQFIELVNQNKIAIIGQTGNLAPADKKLYALRDVTATVDSIPLIASSIMSKKIAAGADVICLDVKTGAGAFMKTLDDARKLAKAMVKIGSLAGRKTMAVISDMNQPLGFAVGNALEVKEAMDTLKGEGPEDLTELCLTLGSHMVYLGGKAGSVDEARNMLEEKLKNGESFDKFKTFLRAQGGDASVADEPEKLPQAKYRIPLEAKEDGYVAKIAADEIGHAAMLLGAGRATKNSPIDLSVGIVLHKKIGGKVQKGEPLLTIYSNSEKVDAIKEKLYKSIHVSPSKTKPPALIYEVITP